MKKLILPSLAILSFVVFGAAATHAQDSASVEETVISPDAAVPAPEGDISADIEITAPPVAAENMPQSDSVVTVTDVPQVAPAPINPDIAMVPPAKTPVLPTILGTPVERELNEQVLYQSPEVDNNAIPSLFFSKWEHDLIIDARNTLNTRPPDGPVAEPAIVIESPRDVILGGIVFVSAKEWTIWVNQRRVTPDSIPTEIMDLKVFKDYIQLEWFDAQTNQIFPIRLRTHQRFNLDARIFLPG